MDDVIAPHTKLLDLALEASLALTDVKAFAVHNRTVDDGLAAAKRLSAAVAQINEYTQGAWNASP